MHYMRDGKIVTCCRCKRPVDEPPKWVRFTNGTIHLAFWCCKKQVGGPIPRREASRFKIEDYWTALRRITLEYDTQWPRFSFDDNEPDNVA
jgi:hypothetical protein